MPASMPAWMQAAAVSSERSRRPPAKRSGVAGFASRRMATASTARSGSGTPRAPRGVPSMGWRKFTGIESGATSRRASANSTSCSSVSPIPTIPPQQICIPRRRAARSVSSFCACVCVEQSEGKSEGAVSRLQCRRASPASLSFARSASETSPSEPQSSMPDARRIARRASQSASTSAGVCARPLVTMPMRSAPFASAAFAASAHASAPTNPCSSQPVFQCALWAHHLQFSGQRPDRAFTMEQKSKCFGAKAAVTRCAASRSSSRGA